MWLNGVPVLFYGQQKHFSGYVPILIRADAAGLNYGATNVLSVFTDGSETTGWWYEGSGLPRHARLTSTPVAARIPSYGITAPAFVEGAYHPRATTGEGLTADGAVVTPTVEVQNAGGPGTPESVVSVSFQLYAADGVTLVGSSSATAKVNASHTVTVGAPFTVSQPELWSIPRPYLHTLVTTLSVGGAPVDAVNTSVGIRSIRWDPELGLYLNEQAVKMRGSCNHESFAIVGSAIPDRVDLLRVQQMRGTGGNAWRTSHNAPEPVLLALTDILGIAVLDENRVFATQENCPGCSNVPTYAGNQVQDMADLVRRDRTHASVIWWSFCNEVGVGRRTGGRGGAAAAAPPARGGRGSEGTAAAPSHTKARGEGTAAAPSHTNTHPFPSHPTPTPHPPIAGCKFTHVPARGPCRIGPVVRASAPRRPAPSLTPFSPFPCPPPRAQGCGDGRTEPAEDFRLVSYINDGSRMVGANMGWISPITPSNMSDILDVMGFSHASYGSVLAFHQQQPGKPLVMTECCSCETQRGEDADMQSVWNPTVYFSNENSGCVHGQTQTSNGVPWIAGTFVCEWPGGRRRARWGGGGAGPRGAAMCGKRAHEAPRDKEGACAQGAARCGEWAREAPPSVEAARAGGRAAQSHPHPQPRISPPLPPHHYHPPPAGTMHDYMGEPGNWPHVSSSFGSYDLSGFPKAPV